jgi:hypothetical protein
MCLTSFLVYSSTPSPHFPGSFSWLLLATGIYTVPPQISSGSSIAKVVLQVIHTASPILELNTMQSTRGAVLGQIAKIRTDLELLRSHSQNYESGAKSLALTDLPDDVVENALHTNKSAIVLLKQSIQEDLNSVKLDDAALNRELRATSQIDLLQRQFCGMIMTQQMIEAQEKRRQRCEEETADHRWIFQPVIFQPVISPIKRIETPQSEAPTVLDAEEGRSIVLNEKDLQEGSDHMSVTSLSSGEALGEMDVTHLQGQGHTRVRLLVLFLLTVLLAEVAFAVFFGVKSNKSSYCGKH